MSRAPGRPPLTWQSALNAFLRRKRITEKTRQKYRWNYTRFFTDLEAAGLNTMPSKIKEKEVAYLLDVAWADLENSTRKWYAMILGMFLRHYGNDVVGRMELRFGQDRRANVDWLTPLEMVNLLDANLTPLQLIITHLEMSLMMRRVEIIRLKLQDIDRGTINVCGKSETLRTIPFHADTSQIIRIWMTERERMVEEARVYRPDIPVPDNLLIWKRYKQKPQIGAYSENGDAIDDQIDLVEKAIGAKFSNHTLRRTGGRYMWKSGKVPIETISEIYGHKSIETTKKYIGVNLDDMDEAMAAFSEYQKELRKTEKGVIN